MDHWLNDTDAEEPTYSEKNLHVYILTNPLVICLVPTAKLNFMSYHFSECLL
jgi:hypothetical protein